MIVDTGVCRGVTPLFSLWPQAHAGLALGLSQHHEVPLPVGAAGMGKNKVATAEDARSVHGGASGWAG